MFWIVFCCSGENNDGADRQQEFEGCADVDDDETDLPSSQKSEVGLPSLHY